MSALAGGKDGATVSEPMAETLAAYFTGSAFATHPSIDCMKIYALDTLAVGLAGSTARSCAVMRQAVLPFAGRGACVFGAGATASPGEAALLNGAASHALELDDDHRVAVLHPGAVVVPAAFALAEAFGASGSDFLRSLLAGYELACRVGEVFRGELFYHGFHPTSVCGVFGAAAAAATLLRLDRPGFARALAIAGTQAAGLTEWRSDGSWIKRLHPGRSAQAGVLAGMLAARGFTGPSTIFEGASGFFTAFGHGKPIDAAALTRGLGETFLALGTAVKPYPCCRFAHGAVDLARDARAALGDPSAIEEVTVRLYRTDVLTYHNRPLNAVDAQFNVPFLVAVALMKGRVGLDDLTETAVHREEVLRLAAKVTVIEDERFTAAYPETYLTSLAITSSDGRPRHEAVSDCPSGDPEAARYQDDPDLFRSETETKARSLLAECGFADRAEPLIKAVAGLERSANLNALAALLQPSP